MIHSSQILIHHLTYTLPDGHCLFQDVDLQLGCAKTGLIGRNAIGKTALLRLIAGELALQTGSLQVTGALYYCSQEIRVAPNTALADFLEVSAKLQALARIENGSISAPFSGEAH